MSAIKAGDLVMVVKPRLCCGHALGLGLVFVVEEISSSSATCQNCQKDFSSSTDARSPILNEIGDALWVPLGRLIKIDPPAIANETEEEREHEVHS